MIVIKSGDLAYLIPSTGFDIIGCNGKLPIYPGVQYILNFLDVTDKNKGYVFLMCDICLLRQSNIALFSSGHVNNVTYPRYAESARVNFIRNFALHIDPEHKKEWIGCTNPKGTGLILRSIKVEFKFVSFHLPFIFPCSTKRIQEIADKMYLPAHEMAGQDHSLSQASL